MSTKKITPITIVKLIPCSVKSKIKNLFKDRKLDRAHQVANEFVIKFLKTHDYDMNRYNYGHFIRAVIKASC